MDEGLAFAGAFLLGEGLLLTGAGCFPEGDRAAPEDFPAAEAGFLLDAGVPLETGFLPAEADCGFVDLPPAAGLW